MNQRSMLGVGTDAVRRRKRWFTMPSLGPFGSLPVGGSLEEQRYQIAHLETTSTSSLDSTYMPSMVKMMVPNCSHIYRFRNSVERNNLPDIHRT
jgi:hypothetical protein